MTIAPTNQATATTPAAGTSTRESSQLDRQAFMKLLIAQLKNQDPLDPMDPREMITQLSQLTSVEHLTGIETQMQALNAVSERSNREQAASWIGRHVVAEVPTTNAQGVVTGPPRRIEGTVTGLSFENNRPELLIGEQQRVQLTQVKTVRAET